MKGERKLNGRAVRQRTGTVKATILGNSDIMQRARQRGARRDEKSKALAGAEVETFG